MAVRDLEAFLRERAGIFDPNLDINPGSPFDNQVIQPLLRRVGPDPFSVDMETFITARLQQAYPEMAIGDGDSVTDLLIKPASLLWDPIVREVARIRRSLSFNDPDSLTTDDADALGSNLIATRAQGDFARGAARISFAQAQNITVSPVNFVTSKEGLRFFPTETQSIRVEEMLINTATDGSFYFDINVIAEEAGSDYNIGPNNLVSIANIEAAIRVANLRKFESGDDAATAAEFVDQTKQELTERSLVTLRGIAAKITAALPEISRLNVVGFNDPEMQRDVVKGGGLGPVVGAGTAGFTPSDGIGGAFTKRFSTLEVDFTALIGPTAVVPSGVVLSVFSAFGSADVVRDLPVTRVVNANELDVETAEMVVGLAGLPWSLRRRELTLSGIPGGILFPDSPFGTVTVPSDEVHIGGAHDVYVQGTSFDEATLTLDNVSDDTPEVSGLAFDFNNGDATKGTLDLTLGSDYEVGDSTFVILERAGRDALTLQIVNGVNAGFYRILAVDQSGVSPVVTVTPAFTSAVASDARWRIFDQINIALTDIKETRVSGTDLITTQNFAVVTTAGAIDFDALGVAQGDILRIKEGPDKGDHVLAEDPLSPGFTSLRLTSVLTSSQSTIDYIIFRPNADGNMVLPLVRISSIELLDSSNQPVGTTIPYANPVDIQSNAFQNPARGIKHSFSDARLGLLSKVAAGGNLNVGGTTFTITVGTTSPVVFPIVFSGGLYAPLSISTVISELNAAFLSNVSEQGAALQVGDQIGIRPIGTGFVSMSSADATSMQNFFGDTGTYSTRDIRSSTVDAGAVPPLASGWVNLNPAIDFETGLDVLQIVDGNQVGFVFGPYVVTTLGTAGKSSLVTEAGDRFFSPEIGVRIQIGARSIGSVRVFFLEPTSFEVRAEETFFSLETDAGVIRFTPDPTLNSQRIPALPNGDKPLDGVGSAGSAVFTSASQDLLLSSIRGGDTVVIDYQPIAGTVVLADPVVGLVNQTLIFSVDGAPDKTLVFIRDDVSLAPNEVSRKGVVDQINASAGLDIVKLTGSNTLEFEADASILIRNTGTANPTILGTVSGPGTSFSGPVSVTNASPIEGTYSVVTVDSQTQATLDRVFDDTGSIFAGLNPHTRQQFKVFREGVQRISTSEMVNNKADASLYFFDVELVSEGTGDQWNISASQQLTVTGFISDGYYLTTEDSNLTFSTVERPILVISKSILENGVDDDPSNATKIAGQNLQVTYDRSSLVEDTQNFIQSETERVICSSPLGRHLIPHFVRLDLNYIGGSREDVVTPDIEDYIRGLTPVEALESSDIQKILSGRGATSITNPIDLIAIVHNVDRTITAARSQNALTTGRLAAFIPDILNIVRNVT